MPHASQSVKHEYRFLEWLLDKQEGIEDISILGSSRTSLLEI